MTEAKKTTSVRPDKLEAPDQRIPQALHHTGDRIDPEDADKHGYFGFKVDPLPDSTYTGPEDKG